MSPSISLQGNKFSNTWLHRWIYYLAAGFIFAAAALRSILVFQGNPVLDQVYLLLAAWLVLFTGGSLFSRRLPWSLAVFISFEVILVLALLLITRSDFLASLFAIVAMQAMQRYSPRVVWILIGISALMTFFVLIQSYGAFQAVALALAFAAVSVFLAAYIWSTRRLQAVEEQQQALVGKLQEANHKLEFQSRQQQQLAAGRERQRLARELHDSVTQTIFSMTLTTQSALLLLERDRQKVGSQLDRLDQLARNALAEMQVLISRLAPESITGSGFVSTLQQHLADRRRLENLSVILEVEGSQPLKASEEAGVFRIIQEALNNVVKHANVLEAVLRLHLAEPIWIEIEDRGTGFDIQQAQVRGRMGLAGMRERASEIGWSLKVDSSPCEGTRIRVEKEAEGV